jgi:hypothetical protein
MRRVVAAALACMVLACGGRIRPNDLLDAGGAGSQDGASSSSGSCTIWASNYDQSCVSRSDCASVSEGDICSAGCCGGPGTGAINVNAVHQYYADESKLPLPTRASDPNAQVCDCIPPDQPCCVRGTCQIPTTFPCPPSADE